MAEREIEFHEAANVFPLMEGKELRELQEDIAAQGLIESIKLHQGKILDGRNRYRACLAAGVEPWFEEWNGEGSPLAFVVSMNLKRRHLDQSQRSIAAAKLRPLFEAEARARQRGGQGGVLLRANLPEANEGRARDKAAAAMNVSPRSVEAGSIVLREGIPELTKAVEKGEVKVSAAAAVATLPKAEQAAVVANGTAAVKQKAGEIRQEKAAAAMSLNVQANGQTTFLDNQQDAQDEPGKAVTEDEQERFEIRAENFQKSVNKVRGFAAVLDQIEEHDRNVFHWNRAQARRVAHSLKCIRDNLDRAIAYLKGIK